MGWGDRLRSAFGMSPRRAEFDDTPSDPVRPLASVIADMVAGTGRVNRADALTVPAVKRGRDIICGLSTLPLQTITSSNRVVRTALLEQIDPNVPNIVTYAQTLEDLLFDAVSWWEVLDFGADGYPSRARHLDISQVVVNSPPDGRTPAPLPSGLDPRGEILVDGRRVSIERIIKFDSPNPALLVVGGRVIRRAFALDKAAEMFAEEPAPRGYFAPKEGAADPDDDDAVQAMLDDWAQWRRVRATGYVPAALDYNPVQQPTPVELQLVPQQQRAALDIANLIGLDPEDLGVSTTSRTYQNAVDRRVDRYNDVLAAYAGALTSRLSMGDVTKRGQTVRIVLDGYLRSDPKTRSDVQDQRLANGSATMDEVRAEEGKPPLPAPVLRPAVMPAAPGRPVAAAPVRVPSTTGRALTASADLAGDPAAEAITFDVSVDQAFAADPVARTIRGLAIPWREQARKNGRLYRFARGGQRYGKMSRLKLLEDHQWSLAFGHAIGIEDTEEGLFTQFSVGRGEHGDRMLALGADKVKDGLSIGVVWDPRDEVRDPENPGGWLVKVYHLKEVSQLANPAFENSRLTSVQASDADGGTVNCPHCGAELQPGVAHTCATPAATPPAPVTFSAEQFDALIERLGNPQDGPDGEGRQVVDPLGGTAVVNEPLPYTFSADHGFIPGPQGYDFSTDLINGGKGDQEARNRAQAWITAQFDVDKADTAALSPNVQRPDMYVDQLDFVTPLWDFISAGTLTDDRPFVVPKFNTSSGLVGPHTEGVEPAPGAISATTQTITASGVSGKVEITRESWDRGGNPQFSGILWRQMLREYYEDREAAVATFLNTLTAATDITLTGTPAATPDNDDDQATMNDLEAALADLNFVRGGNRFRAFAVQQNLYRVMARVKDDGGRPLYPQIAPQNANGTTARGYKTIDIGGTTGVGSWALGAAGGTAAGNSWLFDPEKVLGWATAPRRLQWDFGATVQTANIPQIAYVTVGIWGYLALANTDINGVRQVIFDPSV